MVPPRSRRENGKPERRFPHLEPDCPEPKRRGRKTDGCGKSCTKNKNNNDGKGWELMMTIVLFSRDSFFIFISVQMFKYDAPPCGKTHPNANVISFYFFCSQVLLFHSLHFWGREGESDPNVVLKWGGGRVQNSSDSLHGLLLTGEAGRFFCAQKVSKTHRNTKKQLHTNTHEHTRARSWLCVYLISVSRSL